MQLALRAARHRSRAHVRTARGRAGRGGAARASAASGAVPATSEFASVTGATLHTQHWAPAGAPAASLVFVHGCCDHAGRYGHGAVQPARRGGRGGARVRRRGPRPQRRPPRARPVQRGALRGARGRRGALCGAARADRRLCRVARERAAARLPRGPVARARWARGGLVLMSAAVDVARTPVLRAQAAAGALLSALLPDAALVPAAPTELLTRSTAARAAHAADALLPHDGKLKCRVSYESMRAFEALQPLYGTLAVPLLAMHGTANGIASLDAVRRFVSAAASHDKQLLTWHCAYHELFFEPEADAVVDALLAWLLRRVAAASANDVADAGGALCS